MSPANPDLDQSEPHRTALLTRRSMLTAGLLGIGASLTGAGYLVQHEVIPGRILLAKALGQGGHPGVIPTGAAAAPGEIRRGSFDSPARGGRPTGWAIAYPPGLDPDRPTTSAGTRLPVCVALHGRGGSAESMVSLGYPSFLAVAVRAGLPPFALASVDGGERYWHRRADGEDTGAMVLDEWLPRLAEAGLAARPADKVGFLGWSMGGYGALLLASRLGPDRVAAVAAESPALWLRAGDSSAVAFDSTADFQANDVFARRAVLSRIPICIDCGIADPFHSVVEEFAAGLTPRPVTDFGAGDHTFGYWRRRAPKAINFVGKFLAAA